MFYQVVILAGFAFAAPAIAGPTTKNDKIPEKSAGKEDKKGHQVFVPDELEKSKKESGKGMQQTTADIIETLRWCGIGLLVAGAGAVFAVYKLMMNDKMSSEHGFKSIGLVVVLTLGSFLIVAGYGPNQVASMMGVLGAALGYLLGWEQKKKRR